MPMPRRREARIRATYEMIHTMLALENNVRLENVAVDPYRKIVDFFITGDEDVLPSENRTYDRGEGQEIVISSLDFNERIINRMRQMVQNWDEQHQQEEDRRESQEAMNTLYDQLRSREENGE